MQTKVALLIYGPDKDFNTALSGELARRDVGNEICESTADAMRDRARRAAPEIVFLDCEIIHGWGLDMVYALHKLYPMSALFLCAKRFSINKTAMEEVGVKCLTQRDQGLAEIVDHVITCIKEFRNQQTHVS